MFDFLSILRCEQSAGNGTVFGKILDRVLLIIFGQMKVEKNRKETKGSNSRLGPDLTPCCHGYTDSRHLKYEPSRLPSEHRSVRV